MAGEPCCPEDRSPGFKVMTYNVGNGLARPDRLISTLRSSGADVVALQELDFLQSEAIEKSLSGDYPYQILQPGGFEGRGLVSRHPIHSADRLLLHPSRPDLFCIIDLGGRPLTVIAAHLPPPISFSGTRFDWRAEAQISGLIKAATSRSPAVILGDFNALSSEKPCARLRSAGLIDAFIAAGRGRGSTLPLRLGCWRRLRSINRALMGLPLIPLVRVDYIWHTADVRALEAWLGPDAGSDHLPVLARLEIKG